MKTVAIASLLLLGACTQAGKARQNSDKKPGHVVCPSGGRVILDDESIERTQTGPSNTIFYRSKTTGDLVEVRGDCVTTYGTKRADDWKPIIP